MIEHSSDIRSDTRVARRIRRAYMLALSIIALATLVAFVVEDVMMKRFEASAAALNVVSEQRTLSYRIALFSSDVVTAPDYSIRAMAANNVAQTAAKMAEAHAWLLERLHAEGGEGHLTPRMRAVFFETPYRLDAKFLRYKDKIDAFLDSEDAQRMRGYNAVYFETIGPLGTSLDAAVAQLEKDAMNDVAMMRRIRMTMAIVVLVTLLAEWLLIFRPLARTVEQKTRALEEARNSVTHAAMHDPLTDLANRRMLDSILPTMLAQGARMGKPLTVCHLDLDRFKAVNDTLGHSVGDKVLLHATTVLRNATRGSDFIARVGGDEFVIVDCTFGGYEGASVMAERIIERMALPFEVDGHVCRIGASIGIAIHDEADRDLEAIMGRADIALYYAKELGRGQVQCHSPEAQEAFALRMKGKAA